MKIDFPVVFRWKADFAPSPAYVRACVVFSDESQGEKRVERCTQHTHDASNAVLRVVERLEVPHEERDSNILNRIYVDMKIDFPVVFRWKADFAPSPAYVRACVVFSDESQGEKRVERCTQHTHDASNADISQEIVKNVLHSSREMGTHGVYYCGRPELADSWYSVLVELGPNGGSHAFQFVCKNSCSSGINRRAIDVIFTFEDANGAVYGRQTVGARVCSCPRRDLNRDEEEETKGKPGKRRVQHKQPTIQEPRSKKIKLETAGVDDCIMTLPPVRL
ncbi:p53 DNA-binding domain-containing protein [Phthorimaea operculella]|nr:p53 DNA-binding domain-containing protein [Phthorimaea operculella]